MVDGRLLGCGYDSFWLWKGLDWRGAQGRDCRNTKELPRFVEDFMQLDVDKVTRELRAQGTD